MQEIELKKLRQQIDKVNDQLVTLLNTRATLAQKIGKAKGKGPIYIPTRERQVLQQAVKSNQGPLTNTELTAIFKEIIAACRNLEQRLRVAYLGPEGTYSEEAARHHLSLTSEFIPCVSLAEAVALAEKNERDVAILPIENSAEGSVSTTLDLLLQTNLSIIGETTLPIHHQLLTQAKKLDQVWEVSAHPQALAQCQNWLKLNLPQAKQSAASSNAEAAKLASNNPHMAAIAGLRAAEIYDLPILASNIEDQANNTTRFVILGQHSAAPTGNDKTSLICSVPNTPGSLAKLIALLSSANLNMTKLESRPSPSNLWDYVFYIDIDGHVADSPISQALDSLRANAQFLKILGSYAKAM